MVDTRLVRVIRGDAKGCAQSMELQEHRILPSAHREVGADFLDRRNAENVKRYLLKQLERLGLQVTVRSAEDTLHCPLAHLFSRESKRRCPWPIVPRNSCIEWEV